LATHAGLTVAQLANVESGRVALRLQAAWKVCRYLHIHPNWLLSGFEPIGFPVLDDSQIKWFEKLVEKNKNALFFEVWASVRFLLSEEQSGFFLSVIKEGNIPQFPIAPENDFLTKLSESVNNEIVKPQMPELLERVRKATSEKGEKSKLAELIGVPLASLSQWLSGDREPGGEYTLKLLRWVELQERK
jgi:transcriptional regulator with XRE-family HTH domain